MTGRPECRSVTRFVRYTPVVLPIRAVLLIACEWAARADEGEPSALELGKDFLLKKLQALPCEGRV